MDRSQCLVYLKQVEKTEEIASLSFDRQRGLWDVTFIDGSTYSYKSGNVAVFRPEYLDPAFHTVLYKGAPFTGLSGIYRYKKVGRCLLVKGQEEFLLPECGLTITHSILEDGKASTVLSYLQEVASVNRLGLEEYGERILASRLGRIAFVSDESMLSAYLTGTIADDAVPQGPEPIFPFGCNHSQKRAVDNALSHRLSIIQGPPGTGKTQTILTIVANLLREGMSVEIVSNNNSAVDNVRQKLEAEGLGFLLAPLGSQANKEAFLSSQTGFWPDLSSWCLNEMEVFRLESRASLALRELSECFSLQEELQLALCEQEKLDVEMRHFTRLVQEPWDDGGPFDSSRLLSMVRKYGSILESREGLSMVRRLQAVFVDRLFGWKESGRPGTALLASLHARFYGRKRRELEERIGDIRRRLSSFKPQERLAELSSLSMRLLKASIARRFDWKRERPVFTSEDLWRRGGDILEAYPIVTSTTFSSSASLPGVMYDCVIMDESSQCDIVAGALSMLEARRCVIVGDSKQLSNVVTREDLARSDSIYANYKLPEAYRYGTHSFLTSITTLFPDSPSVLLREHYRCQSGIIGFCNEKFYGGSLVVMTEGQENASPLGLYLTGEGHHSRGKVNQRQADVIAEEVLPALPDDCGSIGIITPYKDNVAAIRRTIGRDDVLVSTIHSFQGREMDTIIFSTTDDVVTDFSDDSSLINVAVSRAKKRFILVASSEAQPAGSNVGDLIAYISYNGDGPVRSHVMSVFDLLYSQATDERLAFLASHRKVSQYDSENLMYALLEDIVHCERFRSWNLGLVAHYPVRYLFDDSPVLTSEERLYLSRTGTHVDFLVYRVVGKVPVLAIEVDGFGFHRKGTRQYDRDRLKDSIFRKNGLPLLRFATNGSGEEKAIVQALSASAETTGAAPRPLPPHS